MSTPDLRRVTFTHTDGDPVLIIDGHDLSRHVRAMEMRATAGDVPDVVLYLSPARLLPPEIDTFARVHVGVEPEPGPAAAVFLAALDAGEVERVALARDDLGNEPGAVTGAILRQLMDWAHGRV